MAECSESSDVPSPNSSGTSGPSRPTHFNSSSAEDPVETCNDGEAARTLISVLKAPTRSALCRPRKVAINRLPQKRMKRPSASATSNPLSVSPTQRVKEFKNKCVCVSGGKLFCQACREELSLKKSTIQLHVASSKHIAGKEKLVLKEKREIDIAQALQKYDDDVHPSGETLPDSIRIYRVKVLTTFLRTGVPINKIDEFRDLLEENAVRLAGRKPISDLIPFVLNEEWRQIKAEIVGLPVAVIFDGTSRLGVALAIILRFVDRSTLTIHQRLVRVQLLTKSMTGEEVARELLSVLSTEYGIASSNLLAAMRDRASVNTVAVRMLKVLYPNLLDIGCYSHTIDHVGDNFDTPILHEFGILWVSLFSHTPHARLLWRTRTGHSMRSYSQTRWWSRWEVYEQLLTSFGDVTPFLNQESALAPTTRQRLLSITQDTQKNQKLQLELAAVIDAGDPFVRATYKLEGDGALVFDCFDVLSSLASSIQTGHFPNLTDISAKLSAGNHHLGQQFLQYGRSCIQPGLDYFLNRFRGDLSSSVAAFKAA